MKKISCLIVYIMLVIGAVNAKSIKDIWIAECDDYNEVFYMLVFETENDYINDFVDKCVNDLMWDKDVAESTYVILNDYEYENANIDAEDTKYAFGYDAMIYVIVKAGRTNVDINKYVIMGEETFVKTVYVGDIY